MSPSDQSPSDPLRNRHQTSSSLPPSSFQRASIRLRARFFLPHLALEPLLGFPGSWIHLLTMLPLGLHHLPPSHLFILLLPDLVSLSHPAAQPTSDRSCPRTGLSSIRAYVKIRDTHIDLIFQTK